MCRAALPLSLSLSRHRLYCTVLYTAESTVHRGGILAITLAPWHYQQTCKSCLTMFRMVSTILGEGLLFGQQTYSIIETKSPISENLKLTLSASIVHSINHSEHSQTSLTRLISSMAAWPPINGPNNVDISPAGQSGTLMQSYNFFLLFLHRMFFHKITNIIFFYMYVLIFQEWYKYGQGSFIHNSHV